MAIIAIFYPDPDNPTKPIYLLVVAAAMVYAWLLRKWHYRKKFPEHQTWLPYLVPGIISWIGFISAHLHPALAIVPIVPFMPGPDKKNLEDLDEEVEEAEEDVATNNKASSLRESNSGALNIEAGSGGGIDRSMSDEVTSIGARLDLL